MLKKLFLILALLVPTSAAAQTTAAFNGFCDQGAQSAQTSGLPSSNKLQGLIPQCTVSVYLTGTVTLATIYSNGTGGTLTNPFKATVSGQWLFYALEGQGYDVVMSGGIPPLVYTTPVTLTDLLVGGGSGPSPGVTWPCDGCIVISNSTNSPAGLAPSTNGDCAVVSGGAWTVGACGGSSSNLTRWLVLSWTGLQTTNNQSFASISIAPIAATVPSGCTGTASDTFPSSYTGGAVSYPTATGTVALGIWDLNTQTQLCTITVSPSGHVGVPSGSGGSISAGDQIIVTGNATPDASYQNFDVTLAVTTTGGGGGGGGGSYSLTTTGTTGTATLIGTVFNIPVYQGQLSLTTTGTSGPATLVGNTLNIPQYQNSGGFTAGGDLSGTSTSQEVVGLLTKALPSLTTGYLYWNGTAFVWNASPAGGTVSNCTTASALAYYAATGTTVGCDAAIQTDGSGNLTVKSVTTNGSGASQIGMTYNSTPLVPGSSTTAVFGVNSTGKGMLSEAGGTAAEICDATNAVCGGSGGLTQIAQVVVSGSSTATITFNSIPGTYSALWMTAWGQTNASADNDKILCTVNSDTTSGHYSYGDIEGGVSGSVTNGGSASAANWVIGNIGAASISVAGQIDVLIPGYTSTAFQKTFNSRTTLNISSGISSPYVVFNGGMYTNGSTPAAITAISCKPNTGTDFAAGTVFTLYGMQ